MKPCLFVFITFASIVALVIFIMYMCNLHARVSRLENKAAPHLEIIEREIHGIGFYIRIIVGIAIFFCVGICVHYIAVFYPRISKIKDFEHYTSSIGVDYWGVIVGFMALLVTLLVGWQIFSTIKAKDELYNTKDEIERRFTERLENFDECCKHGRSKIAELDDDINLCKTSVARKILKYLWDNNLGYKNAEIYNINSKQYFNVDVNACLFFIDFSKKNSNNKCYVYNELNNDKISMIYVYNNHTIINNIDVKIR